MVKKRGNARFFHINNQGQITNPPVGTVIDNTVTKVKTVRDENKEKDEKVKKANFI